MMTSIPEDSCSKHSIVLHDAPAVSGLGFRHFMGESDYSHVVRVLQLASAADELEFSVSIEDVKSWVRHMENCDPNEDLIVAEIHSKVIGLTRLWWNRDPNGVYLYNQYADLIPEWRGKGIRNAMLRYSEQRLSEAAEKHPTEAPRFFQSTAADSEKDWITVLTAEGYGVYRYGFHMKRPNLEDIPDFPLPESIEVRPAKPEHYRAIIDAWNEACKDMRSQIPISDENFKALQESPMFNPFLWQIAWHNDEVVGTVLNFINEQENLQYNRKRGYVEAVSVKRRWRGTGIAKALIARSLRLLRDKGMSEAALGVDAENPSGALRLYQKMGFQVERQTAIYRKKMN